MLRLSFYYHSFLNLVYTIVGFSFEFVLDLVKAIIKYERSITVTFDIFSSPVLIPIRIAFSSPHRTFETTAANKHDHSSTSSRWRDT